MVRAGQCEVSSQDLQNSIQLKNVLFSEGSDLIARLHQDDAEKILQDIGYRGSPLASAVRNGIARRSDNLRLILQSVDDVVQQTQSLIHDLPDELGGTLIAVVKDCVNPFTAAVRQSTLKTVESKDLIFNAQMTNMPQGEARLTVEEVMSHGIFHQGSQLIGVLPQKYANTILSAMKSSETPLANMMRKKIRKQALEIDSLLRNIDQAIDECRQLLFQTSHEVLESLLTLVCDGSNDFAMLIRGRLSEVNFSKSDEASSHNVADNSACVIDKHPAGTSPKSEPYCAEPVENHDEDGRLVVQGEQLVNALPFEQAQMIMEKIKHIQSPVVKAIRLKLSQHKAELESILDGMGRMVEARMSDETTLPPKWEHASEQEKDSDLPKLDSDLFGDSDLPKMGDSLQSAYQGNSFQSLDGPCDASLGDELGGFPTHKSQRASINPSNSSPTIIESIPAGEELSKLPSAKRCETVDVITAGRLLLGPLPPASAGAVLSALRSADQALSAAVRAQLVQDAAQVADLLGLVQAVVDEAGPMVSGLPPADLDAVLDAMCAPASECPVAIAFRRAMALGDGPREELLREDSVAPTQSDRSVSVLQQDNADNNIPYTEPAISLLKMGQLSAPSSVDGACSTVPQANSADPNEPSPASPRESPVRPSGVEPSDLKAPSPAAADNTVEDVRKQLIEDYEGVLVQENFVPESRVMDNDIQESHMQVLPVAATMKVTVASEDQELVHCVSCHYVDLEAVATESEIDCSLDHDASVQDGMLGTPERLTGTGASMAETARAGRSASVRDARTSRDASDVDSDVKEFEDGTGDSLGREGEVMVRLLGGAEAEAFLQRFRLGDSALAKALAPSQDRDDPAYVAETPWPNINRTGDRKLLDAEVRTDIRSEESGAHLAKLSAAKDANEAAGSAPSEVVSSPPGDMEQMLFEGGELVLHLPADVADAICALISRARTPLAAGIRERVMPLPSHAMAESDNSDYFCTAAADFAIFVCEDASNVSHGETEVVNQNDLRKVQIMQGKQGNPEIMMDEQRPNCLNQPELSQICNESDGASSIQQQALQSMSVICKHDNVKPAVPPKSGGAECESSLETVSKAAVNHTDPLNEEPEIGEMQSTAVIQNEDGSGDLDCEADLSMPFDNIAEGNYGPSQFCSNPSVRELELQAVARSSVLESVNEEQKANVIMYDGAERSDDGLSDSQDSVDLIIQSERIGLSTTRTRNFEDENTCRTPEPPLDDVPVSSKQFVEQNSRGEQIHSEAESVSYLSCSNQVQSSKGVQPELLPPDLCPKSEVSLVAESWTPESSSLSTTVANALSVAVPSPHFCDAKEQGNTKVSSTLLLTKTNPIESEVILSKFDLGPRMQSAFGESRAAQSPQHTDFFDPIVRSKITRKKEESSISKLRDALYKVCKRRGVKDANLRIEELLRTSSDDCPLEAAKLTLLPLSKFASALFKFGLQLRKYLIRPLQQDISLFEKDKLKVEAFLLALNSDNWWPLETDLESNTEHLERLRQKLELKFGPKIAGALCIERNFEYLESLLDEAERNDEALREMRSYVDERLQTKCLEDLPQLQLTEKVVTNVRTNANIIKTIEPKELIPSPYEPSRTANPNLQTSVRKVPARAVTMSRLSCYSKIDSAKSSDPAAIRESKCDSLDRTNTDAGYFPALSRQRGIEYSRSSLSKPNADSSSRFWRRLPFPMNALEYKRWGLLKDPIVPGFSDPKCVPVSTNGESWVSLQKIPIKSGSRFREPISKLGIFEALDKSGMHKADLKLQRFSHNLLVRGEDHLRDAKKFVAIGNFDGALRSAASALQIFKSTGENQRLVCEPEDTSDPLKFVSSAIQSDIERRLKLSRLQLGRSNFQKALEQIPSLLQGARWLKQTHNARLTGDLSSIPNFSEVELRIQVLTSKIIEAQKASALSVEALSLASYFASVKEEFEADGTLTTESIDHATKCKNRLPETIVADGRAYTLVLNVKPAEMPAKFQLGAKLKIQGAAVLGSGRRDDGRKARYGTVTAFNESSSKYKIQYLDDYEWMCWPGTGTNTVEIDIYPEDVEIEIPGFFVHSKTVNLTRSMPKKDAGLIMVVFAVTPSGPPFDSSPFGRVCASVTGLKSGKPLLDSMESGIVEIIPPSFMLPASRYDIFDALHHQHLEQGVAEFTHMMSKQTYAFSSGQEVCIPQDGIYNVCFKGQTHFEHPSFNFSHRTCIVQNSARNDCRPSPSRVFLNEPLLQKDELRIVVSWDAEPHELDLHIYTSSGQHICDESYDPTTPSGDVRINMDSVAGFGPETATIRVRRHLSYSVSVCLSHKESSQRVQWACCNATIALYDCTGIFSMFHLPPSKNGSKCLDWWHVFSLDGFKWDSAGHGVLRINRLMANEMPQMALPGWLLVKSARHGLWDEFKDTLCDIVQKNVRRNNMMIMPRDLANATSLEGETILGLIALHNEDDCEDPSKGNEDGNTPLQNQIESLRVFMRCSERQTEAAESLLSRGLPTFETFSRECKRCGDDECFIFRAVAYASVDVAVQILNYLNPVVRQCLPGHGYRGFFESRGERLLITCIEKRNSHSILFILRCILDIEAIWQRRATRKFQKRDRVQAEIPAGSGKWLNCVILRKVRNAFEVRLTKNPDFLWQDETSITDEAECDEVVMSEILSSQLRWRSQVIEHLKAKLVHCREKSEGSKEHQLVGSSLKLNSPVESVYSEALSLLSEKLLPALKC